MDAILIITILIVIFALAFDFINGFHDTANAIATSVSTRALPPRTAVMLLCYYELPWSNFFCRSSKSNC